MRGCKIATHWRACIKFFWFQKFPMKFFELFYMDILGSIQLRSQDKKV